MKLIPLAIGCGEDDICHPKLSLDASFDGSYLILGERDSVNLTVVLSNAGESAYFCKLNAKIPVDVKQLPALCLSNQNELRCDVSNQFKANQTVGIAEISVGNVTAESNLFFNL